MTMSRRHQTICQLLVAIFAGTSLQGTDMTLKASIGDRFYIGAAMGRRHFDADGVSDIVAQEFSSLSPCNELKWGPFNPKPEQYNHEAADRFVGFGTNHGMYVVGHVLFWHNQTPAWVFEDGEGNLLGRDALLKRMRERVRHVAQRYGSRINAWDVVNESIENNGKLRDSEWVRIIGDDFIEQAFRIADEELPKDVELIYNDFSMTAKGKRDAVVRMIRTFQRKGIRIDGVGMQGHWSLKGPSLDQIEASIVAFANAGVDVHISELDIDVLPRHPEMWSGNADVKLRLAQDPTLDPYTAGLPERVRQELATRYANLFGLFLKHQDQIKRVTFWGVTDGDSWLNNWPIKGRTNYPLLFDRKGERKSAYFSVMALAKGSKGSTSEE